MKAVCIQALTLVNLENLKFGVTDLEVGKSIEFVLHMCSKKPFKILIYNIHPQILFLNKADL